MNYNHVCFVVRICPVSTLHCFAKAGISRERQDAALKASDDSFKELQEQVERLSVCASELFQMVRQLKMSSLLRKISSFVKRGSVLKGF